MAFSATKWRTALSKFTCIQLQGRNSNPDASGAQVSLTGIDGKTRTQQISAGGGYLSQSSPRLFFGIGGFQEGGVKRIDITWPDGKKSTHQIDDLEKRGGRYWIKEQE